MPRNSAGVYILPSSDVNPPVSGTVIDPVAFAAQNTDIASEITNSVDRLGRGAMQAALAMGGNNITNAGAPVGANDVARLVDISSYLPPGVMMPFCGVVAPTGWLLCDGTAYLIATYPALAAAMGTNGTDGVSWNQIVAPPAGSFHVPDLRGVGIRGLDSGKGLDPSRVFASYQADMFASHTHVQNAHNHFDPGHSHGYSGATGTNSYQGGSSFAFNGASGASTGPSGAGLGAAIATNQTTGSVETVGKNLAAPFIIRT